MLEIREYINNNGRAPYSDWLKKLGRQEKVRVLTRVDRIRRGNFGDAKSVGDGVSELRLDFGPGYRVYFGREGDTIVVLLCGGDKDSQARDIKRAKELWSNHILEGEKHGHKTLQPDTT